VSELTILVFPDDEKLYIELQSLITLLRSTRTLKDDDEIYNAAVKAVANYLEEKQNDLLAEHIISREAQDVKDKDRLN